VLIQSWLRIKYLLILHWGYTIHILMIFCIFLLRCSYFDLISVESLFHLKKTDLPHHHFCSIPCMSIDLNLAYSQAQISSHFPLWSPPCTIDILDMILISAGYGRQGHHKMALLVCHFGVRSQSKSRHYLLSLHFLSFCWALLDPWCIDHSRTHKSPCKSCDLYISGLDQEHWAWHQHIPFCLPWKQWPQITSSLF